MNRATLVAAFSALLLCPLSSDACETRNISFAGNLDSQTLDGASPPPLLSPINDQIAAAQVVQQVELFDSLGAKHSAVGLFFRVGGSRPWIARMVVTDPSVEFGSESNPFVGDIEMSFDAQGERNNFAPISDGGTVLRFTNNGGVNRAINVQFAVTNKPSANQTRAEQDGREGGCTKRGSLDFDGDGYDDFAIWRPEFGMWAVLKSSVQGADLIFKQCGLPGDYPIPGDYTGDGKADLVLYRGTTAFWFICRSELNYDCSQPEIVQFGLPGDIPVQGDYDGDGILNIAVYRISTGTFFYRSRNTDIIERQWGLPGDIPLKAAINRPQ